MANTTLRYRLGDLQSTAIYTIYPLCGSEISDYRANKSKCAKYPRSAIGYSATSFSSEEPHLNRLSSEKWGLISGLAGDDFQGDDPPIDCHGDGRGVGVLPGPRSGVRSPGSWNYCVRG